MQSPPVPDQGLAAHPVQSLLRAETCNTSSEANEVLATALAADAEARATAQG